MEEFNIEKFDFEELLNNEDYLDSLSYDNLLEILKLEPEETIYTTVVDYLMAQYNNTVLVKYINYLIKEKEFGLLDELILYFNANYYYDEKIIEAISKIEKLESMQNTIFYLNDIVLTADEDDSISDYIFEFENIAKFVTQESIVMGYAKEFSNWKDFDKDNLEKKNEYKQRIKNESLDTLRNKFINDNKINFFIKNLSSKYLIEIFPFNLYINTNPFAKIVIKEFIKEYFSYEKALFFIDKLRLSDKEKKQIIFECFRKNILDIKVEKRNILKKETHNLLVKNTSNKEMLLEVFELEYNEELYKKLISDLSKIDNFEILTLFINQLIRKECKEYDLDIALIDVISWPNFAPNGLARENSIVINYQDKSLYDEEELIEYIYCIYHEIRHLIQMQKKEKNLSLLSIICSMEEIITNEEEGYYKLNYSNTYIEVDANDWAYYKTYNFLKKIDEDKKNRYIKKMVNEKKFIMNRRMLKHGGYLITIINKFFELIEKSPDKIQLYSIKYPNILYVVDDKGKPINIEEISKKLNESKNIKEFYFYKSYLKLIDQGIKENTLNMFKVKEEEKEKNK